MGASVWPAIMYFVVPSMTVVEMLMPWAWGDDGSVVDWLPATKTVLPDASIDIATGTLLIIVGELTGIVAVPTTYCQFTVEASVVGFPSTVVTRTLVTGTGVKVTGPCVITGGVTRGGGVTTGLREYSVSTVAGPGTPGMVGCPKPSVDCSR